MVRKKSLILLGLFLVFFLNSCQTPSDLTIGLLTCNQSINPLSVERQRPYFSWEISSAVNAKSQLAYHIQVADLDTDLLEGKGLIWDSGKITSDQSVNVLYDGKPLDSGKRYFWRVKVWDENDRESAWSDLAFWQMGLFTENAWHNARWIAYEQMDSSLMLVPGIHGSGDHLNQQAKKRPVVPLFRKSFQIEKELTSATLSVSGLGHYEAFVNGDKVGDSFLSPGWTDYDETVLYNTYDITSMLHPAENVLGTIVGNGFYNINRERYRKLVITYGMPEMICHVQLNYANGSSDYMVSDETWKSSPSPITFTSIYGGEDYDARLEQNGWNKPEFDDSAWQQVVINKGPKGDLTSEKDHPLEEMESIPVNSISRLKDGSFLYDFGQNASGIIELTVNGKAGQQVKLCPSELINADSTCNQRASGSPYSYGYTLKGDGIETWKPKFTYYGFRYVQVFGAIPSGEDQGDDYPVIEKMNLLHTRNSSPSNGTFTCSSELLNRIYKLIDWGIKSNFQSVLTDCPHREKLGWLEQTFLMGEGVHFNYDIYQLYRKQVFDMMDAQTPEGLLPDIAPEYVEFIGGFRDSPEWGSAAVIVPYLLYKWYGDKQVVEDAWEMMMSYVEYLKSKSQGHILDYGLGDWFDLGPKQPGVAQLTPVSLTATAIYYYDLKLLAEMAEVCKRKEKDLLKEWRDEVGVAFNEKFYQPETQVYSTGSQTSMAMPLCLGLVEPKDQDMVFANLVDSIIAGNKALTAGDVGFHYLVDALNSGGASQLLFDMINRDDVPGYGFQLKKGATALTESWQALEVVSNNHLMLGHVMEWFYAGLAGIGQSKNSVAYKEIEIKPQLVDELSFVKASFHSPYGIIRSGWSKTERELEIEVEIPVNTTGTVYVPTTDAESIKVNGEKPIGSELSIDEKGKVVLQIESGTYLISCSL